MTLRHSHQCSGKPCRSRTVGASGFPASATCIRRPVESVTNSCVTPGSSGISVGCARPDAAGPWGASGVSVTTPLYYIRTSQCTTSYLRRGPLVIMDRLAERRCVSRSACGTLSRLVASESMSQSGLLDSEGPGPVIALPQPAWADAYVHDVGIMGAFHFVRVLGEVGLQTPIGVGGRWNVGGRLTLDLSLSQPIPSGTQVKG